MNSLSEIHVLRLTPHFYWPQLESQGWPVQYDAIGGMQTQILEQTLALSAAGIAQTVLTLRIPGAPDLWQLDQRTVVKGVRIPLFPVRSRLRGMVDLNVSWALGVLDAMRRLPRPIDIIHVHWSGVAVPPLMSWLLKKMHRARMVATVHCSSLATYHAMSAFDVLQHRFARFVERHAMQEADQVVVLTSRLATVLGQEDRLRERISIVPDAIDCAAFASTATPAAVDAFKSRFGLPIGVPIVGYVGRVAREKGWRSLLDIAQLMVDSPAHFLVCGDGNERDLLERELAQRDMRGRFTVTGYVPHKDVAVAIRACDVLILTSRHEEFGSVLLEAMAVGTPAVAFRVGGIPIVLADGAAGVLVPDGSVDAMAEAIRQLLASPLRREQIKRDAIAHVARNFDRAAATARMLEIYQNVTSKPQSSPA